MFMIVRLLIGCLIIAGLTLFGGGSGQAASDIQQIDTSELLSMMERNKESLL